MDRITDDDVSDLLSLQHPASRVFLFKRRDGDVITRKLDDSRPLSERLRLRGAMFSHHMPWGYGALFEGYGLAPSEVDLEALPIEK